MMLKNKPTPTSATKLLVICCAALLLQGCGRVSAHNPLGERHPHSYQVTEQGKHKITVVAPSLGTIRDGLEERDGVAIKRLHNLFTGNTEVVIKNETLTVDGKNYGRLNQGDAIIVDHGKVFVNAKEVQEIASR